MYFNTARTTTSLFTGLITGCYKRKGSQTDKGFSRVKPRAAEKSASTTSSRNVTVEVILTNGNRAVFFESDSLDLFNALLWEDFYQKILVTFTLSGEAEAGNVGEQPARNNLTNGDDLQRRAQIIS